MATATSLWPIGSRSVPVEGLSEALAAARRGDEDGIRILYRWLNPPLLRYLRFHAGGASEDLASEVWLSVAGQLAAFESGPAELRALVFTIARRRVVDHYRRQARAVSTVPVEEMADHPALADTEELALAAVMTRRAIDTLVRDLPSDQAEILLLRVLGDLDVAEVARIVGKSPGAVRVAQHRALRQLRSEPSGTVVTP